MSDIDENWIRNRAHELWEAEGCPNGKELDHWFQAMDEYLSLVKTDGESSPSAPVPVQDTGSGEAAVKRQSRSPGKTQE